MSSQGTAREYENIIVSRPATGVGLITLNRPKALNALSSPLFEELNYATAELDADDGIGALIITGSERAFAGAFRFLDACLGIIVTSWESAY